MGRKYKRRATDNIKVSIGTKLVLIISAIVLLSLGSITALVTVLISQDLRVTAEANNFEVNRRSALEAENTFSNIRANSNMLIQLIHYGEADVSIGSRVFFEQNPGVAAVAFASQVFVNEHFFFTREISEDLAEEWALRITTVLYNTPVGQTMLFNEAPAFSISLLTMVFPSAAGSAAALFSAESLSDGFGFGTNQSWLVNSEDDILVHSDFDLVLSGANVAHSYFIQLMRRSPQRSLQTLYTDEDGIRYFSAFTKLATGDAALITTIEHRMVFEGIITTTWRNGFLTIAVLSISILLIWFFAKTISVPIQALTAVARRIEGGFFDVKLTQKGHDEIGLLTLSFQKMGNALGIFGKFTNKGIALLAMSGQIKPGGQPRHATIFFSDIRNFTSISESFTNQFADASERIVLWLNEYLSSMVECVEKTNGTIDKFIGDSVMAHWGTATTSGSIKQDALNCILSALMMRAALFKMNQERVEGDEGNPPITIGCGINTGMVTAGQLGSNQRMEYTVVGDAVNLAARLETLNKTFGTDILISEDTWELVKEHIIYEEMPTIYFKGKEKSVRVFAVINLVSNPTGPKTLGQLRKLLDVEPDNTINIDASGKEIKFTIGK